MKKQALPIISLAIVIAAIAYFIVLKSGWFGANTEPGKVVPQEPPAGAPGSLSGGQASPNTTHTISMDNNGFNPPFLQIKVGDTVTFKNDDNRLRWPASGNHPTHEICPGFDAKEGLRPGETYSFTFNEEKECPFHDHMNPTLLGKITAVK